jgi:hypothetical protein
MRNPGEFLVVSNGDCSLAQTNGATFFTSLRSGAVANTLVLDTGRSKFSGPVKLKRYTVSTLPAGQAGDLAFATDCRVFNGTGTQEGGGSGTGGVVSYNVVPLERRALPYEILIRFDEAGAYKGAHFIETSLVVDTDTNKVVASKPGLAQVLPNEMIKAYVTPQFRHFETTLRAMKWERDELRERLTAAEAKVAAVETTPLLTKTEP